MTPTLVASPGDMAVTVELAIPRAAKLPFAPPIVALPLSACSTDWTQVARDTLDECRYTLTDCEHIGIEAKRYAKKYEISPESAVEEVILDGSWL